MYAEPRARNDKSDVLRIDQRQPADGTQFAQFSAFSIPMRNWDRFGGVVNIDGLNVPNGGTADILVTGMLTACAFMYTTDKTDLWCAHIQPTLANQPGVKKGLALGTNLRAAPAFTNTALAVKIFSHREYSFVHHANVIGVRKGDGWSLYAQAVTQDNGIIFARQLV